MSQTVRGAARTLRVCTRSIYNFIAAGDLVAHKAGGDWVIELAESQRAMSTAALADATGYSQRYIRMLICRGAITATRIGKLYRVTIDEAVKLMIRRLGAAA